jgi:hypothetical protein
MLQRMAQIMPDWRERSPADLGITLVEMLAYVGDRLSYAQDAVATEAYLGTARSRVSVRRHARLVDYAMHDGANARAFVHVRVTQDGRTIRLGEDRFLTRLTGLEPVIDPGDEQRALDRDPEVFEPLHDCSLAIAHNTIRFYDWGGSACCLPAGATRATLRDDGPAGPLALAPGDVLVFEERLGPRTGEPADADPLHRHPVRLTAVQAGITDVLDGTPIVEIRWAEDDALPFPLCLSARLDETAGGGLVRGRQPRPRQHRALRPRPHHRRRGPRCRAAAASPSRPRLRRSLRPAGAAGSCPTLRPSPRRRPGQPVRPVRHAPLRLRHAHPVLATRRPAVALASTTPTGTGAWSARRDLLASLASDRHFVVELERDGRAALRFGDDMNGLRPASGTAFRATYRTGNGTAGNVGAGAIHHVVTDQSGIEAVRNPLAATGGLNPESIEEVRRAAPYAYRRQERAVTEADYAEVALRHPDVQRAAATFRWNGHGHTVFVSVDRFGGRPVTEDFRADLVAFLDRFRMAGYDVQVDAPRFVALEIELFVCVCPDHFRAAVRQAVLERLSNRALPGSRRGFFHPDNFSFGDPVRLSALYAAVMEVAGVTSVVARVFQRRGRPDPAPLDDGVLPIDRLEIARLDNDPNFAERGTLTLELGGGK